MTLLYRKMTTANMCYEINIITSHQAANKGASCNISKRVSICSFSIFLFIQFTLLNIQGKTCFSNFFSQKQKNCSISNKKGNKFVLITL